MNPIFVWPHRDAQGRVIGEIRRFIPGREGKPKEDIPCYNHDGRGFQPGIPNQMKEKGYPIFGGETVTDKAQATIATEGQKAQAAYASLGFQSVTSILGASCAHSTSWQGLDGVRTLYLSPDNDVAGEEYAKSVFQILSKLPNPPEVKVVRLPGLPHKGDICDWLKQQPELTDWDELQPLDNHPSRNVLAGRLRITINDNLHPVPIAWLEPETSSNNEASPWDAPIMFGEIKTPEITTDSLPECLREYAESVHRSTQTPPGMSLMVALSTISTCLQKRFVVSPYGDSYVEPVNLWTITALPPASRKTAVIEAFTKPLTEWESEQAQTMGASISETETIREVNTKRIDKLQAKAASSESGVEREKLVIEINELRQQMPDPILPPRLWTGDVTPERLQNLMVEHNERMAVLSDEGGIFEIMGGLYSDGKANIDVFLQAHAGKSVRVDRGKRAAYLNNPALTFGLAVQPEVISDLSQGSKRRFRGKGALARFLYCLPPSNIGTRDVTRRTAIPETLRHKYHAKIYNLLDTPALLNEAGVEYPRILRLEHDALHSWTKFSQFIEVNQGPGQEFEAIQDWTGKLPGAALRIAGNCHVVEYGPENLLITKITMERALDLCTLLIKHAQAAFDLMGDDQVNGDAKHVLKWILIQGALTFKQSDCHRALHGRFKKVDRLLDAFENLADRNIISEPEKLRTKKPTIIYNVNPAIFREGASDGLA